MKRYSHIRESQPRLASLVCPFQRKRHESFLRKHGSNRCHSRSGTHASPHMPRCSAFLICLSCRLCPIRPCGAPSPRGEGCDTRIPSSKKTAHHPCEPIRSPSTVIPSAAEGSLLHCRHMHTCALTQTTPWCFLFRLSLAHDLPLCKKDPSTSVGMTFKGNG